jgi:hypothetical protein
MAIDLKTLFEAIESHQEASGFFERVARHEPKASPGDGVTAANWFQRISPIPIGSGLNSTSIRIELVTRLYAPFLAAPQDAIDTDIYSAASYLFEIYSADFTLGGNIRNIDLLGHYGEPMQSAAGFLNQSGVIYRVFDITMPLIVNDAFPQAP